MAGSDRYVIELCGHRYEVRGDGSRREVLCEGRWRSSAEFVDLLRITDQLDQIAELAKLGLVVLKTGSLPEAGNE